MSWSPSRRPPDLRSPPKLTTRRKRSGLRCRSLLLIFLCMLWIYHGIGQRTRNFESSETTSDLTEGTLTTPARNEGSILSPHSTIFDDVSDSPPSKTIAAVLLITSPLPHLFESLPELSAIPHLTEIHLLCPENVTSAVRNELRRTLSRAQGSSNTEFFVIPWRHEWSEAESALRAASSILSDGILIIPQDALVSIDTISRDILFSGSPSLRLPVGLCGSGVSYEERYQGFLTVRFVLPPLLLPSRLGITNRSYFHLTSWQEVGAHFTQVEGVGGVVLPETAENTNSCHHLNASEMVPLHLGHSHSPSDSLESNGFLVILVAERGDIPAFSRLACKYKSRGNEVKVIAYEVPPDPIPPSDFASEGCNVTYAQVHDLQDPTLYQLLGRLPGVLLTLKEYHLPPESPFATNTGATVIRIPRRDLSHCDWIASLGIRELRSEFSRKVRCSGSSDRYRLARP